jgi:putative phosphoribosyl transferase
MTRLPFTDRYEAGRLLAAELAKKKLKGKILVLALPRGGLPVADPVAKALHAPLNVVVVRKLGVPWQPELAMGAIAGGSPPVLDWETIHSLGVSQKDIDTVVARETAEIKRREKLYRDGRPEPGLEGRTVILVDDGLATGSTMLAAARYVRSRKPAKLIIAVPVASVQACEYLRHEADACVCLATPESFMAVGQWYVDFDQVSDSEVRRILAQGEQVAEEPALQRGS